MDETAGNGAGGNNMKGLARGFGQIRKVGKGAGLKQKEEHDV